MKNQQKSEIKRIFLILPMLMAFVLSGNAHNFANNVSGSTNDTVAITKKNTEIKSTTIGKADKKGVYMIIDKMPQFPGGEKVLLDYISRNVKYPIDAQEKGIQGRVIIRFVVNKTGKVENVEVLRGLYPSIDAEGLRVVNSLPDWIPGEEKGEKVSVYYTLPITFKLTGGKESSNNFFSTDPDKKPVFILDGKILPQDFNLNSINKNSIQSVNVLKPDNDQKKAELINKYGEKAVNGVIVITSKKVKWDQILY